MTTELTDKQYEEKYGNDWKLVKQHEGWTDEQWQEKYSDMWEYMKNQDAFMRLPIEEQNRIREGQIMAYEERKTSLAKIKGYAELEEVKKRFINLLGDRDGRAYVESVVIMVAAREDLQECSAKSIMIAASRAASLKLSVDPILHQAHLVKFGKEATLIIDYHGLVQLSTNTGYYEIAPNVFEVYQGEVIQTDRFSGKITITGERVNNEVIGWCSYFKAKNGTERYLYMSNEECDEWGKKYNPKAFANPKTPWGTERPKMRRKTVLRRLVSLWGNFSPQVQTIMMRDEVIDADMTEFPSDDSVILPEEEKKERRPMDVLMGQLGYSHDAEQ